MTDVGIESRLESIKIVFKWMRTGSFPDRMMGDVPPESRAFVMDIVYGTVRWARLLDEIMGKRVHKRPSDDAAAAIMIGIFQLLKMPAVPAYAAIDTTVEALKIFGGRRAPFGLVNAVLRSVDRERESIAKEIESMPPAVRFSHPDELVDRWTARWGEEKTAALCEWNNNPACIMVTVLPHGPSADELMARFKAAGIPAEPLAVMPDEAITIGHGVRAESLPGFSEGDFALQDPATLDAVRLVGVKPGMRVLDACASPGGKAARMARLLDGKGELVAVERHDDRMQTLQDTLERLAPGAPVKIVRADASSADPDQLGGKFDRVLVDAPCSNSGVLRRRPDARWRFDRERLSKLLRIQESLLENAARLVVPGGCIVYSTCSIDEEENEKQAERFLSRHPDFTEEERTFRFPVETGTDGSFAVRFRYGR